MPGYNPSVKITRPVLFGLILLMVCGCRAGNNKKSSEILVHGSFENAARSVIYVFSYPDTNSIYLGLKAIIDSSLVDQRGNYSFHIRAHFPFAFNLETKDSVLVSNLFLTPGDELELNFKGENNQPEIGSSGQASRFNNFLLQLADTFYKDPETRKIYYISTNYMSLPRFTDYCRERMDKQLGFFHRYFKDETLQKEFGDYALHTIRYGIGCDKLMYLWKKRMKQEPVSVDSSWFDFITPAFLENRDALFCPAYIRFLNLYLKDYYERMQEKRLLSGDYSRPPLPAVEKFRLAGQLFHRPFRDVVWLNIITDEMKSSQDSMESGYRVSMPLDSMITWFKSKYPEN